MKAQDFMIGDIVAVNNTPLRIAALGTAKAGFIDAKGEMFYHYYDNIEPIPLTTEILEKNGFELQKQDFTSEKLYKLKYESLYVETYSSDIDPRFRVGCSIGDYIHFNIRSRILMSFCTIHYVHELQRALKLCGIDKNIEL